MNKLREAGFLRWKKQLDRDLSKIPSDRESLLKKAALCGFLAGDGSVQIRKEKSNYHHQLDFFPDDDLMLQTYCSFIKELYGKDPKITRRDNVYNARLSQKFIVLDLLQLCDFGIYKWNFPNQLFKIKGAKELWLRAFFSAEAYVNDKVIKTQSVNIVSIKRVLQLLSDLDIKGNYYEYTPKNKNHSKVGMIFINDKKARITYYHKVGFWHSKKERLLKEALGL